MLKNSIGKWLDKITTARIQNFKKFEYTPEEFVNIDHNVPTKMHFTDTEIVDMVCYIENEIIDETEEIIEEK